MLPTASRGCCCTKKQLRTYKCLCVFVRVTWFDLPPWPGTFVFFQVESVWNAAMKKSFDCLQHQFALAPRKMFQCVPAHFCDVVCQVGFNAECAPPDGTVNALKKTGTLYIGSTTRRLVANLLQITFCFVFFVSRPTIRRRHLLCRHSGKGLRGVEVAQSGVCVHRGGWSADGEFHAWSVRPHRPTSAGPSKALRQCERRPWHLCRIQQPSGSSNQDHHL